MDLKDSQIYFGRVPPNFAQTRYPGLQTSSLLGNLRGITTSNPGSNSLLNPLYNKPGRISPHCKVVPNCQNRIIKSVSFGGHGHVEVKSQPLRPFRSSASDLTRPAKRPYSSFLLGFPCSREAGACVWSRCNIGQANNFCHRFLISHLGSITHSLSPSAVGRFQCL